MNKMQKGIVAVTVLVIAIILMIAIIIAAPKTTVKREADIEQKRTYVDAAKTLTLWYSDDACDAYMQKCVQDYYEHTGIAVEAKYVEDANYLEQIYDATMADTNFPDVYLSGNDAMEKAKLYGIATADSYELYFNTLLLAYHTDSFASSPASIQEILDFGQNNLLGEGVGNLLEWNLADGFYNYPFAGDGIEFDESSEELQVSYDKEKYNQELTFYQSLAQKIDMDALSLSREQVIVNFDQEETLTALIDSDDLALITAEEYGIAQLPMLNDTLSMKGIASKGVLLINEFSTQKEEARAFAEFVQTSEADCIETMTGHISLNPDYIVNANSQTAYAQYQQSTLLPQSADAGVFWQNYAKQMTDIWNGGALPE